MAYGIIRIEVICVSVGKRIMQARKKAGLTQAQLAETLGLATITIRQYESDKRKPSIEQLKRISNVLKVRWYELMSDDRDEQASLISNDIFEIDESFLDYKKYRKLNMIQERDKVDREYIDQLYSEDLEKEYEAGFDEFLDKLIELFHEKYPQRIHREEIKIDDETLKKFTKMIEISYRAGILEGRNGVKPPNAETLIATGLDETSAEAMMQFTEQSLEEKRAFLTEKKPVHIQKLETEEND